MPLVPITASSSSDLSSEVASAESATSFGASDAPDTVLPHPASATVSASAPKRLRFTELRVRPGGGTGLLNQFRLIVHLVGGAVETVAGDAQSHFHQELAGTERPH